MNIVKKIRLIFLLILVLFLTSCTNNNIYKVNFIDHDGSIIKTELVELNGSAIAPKSPIKEGYTFVDWDLDFSSITEDIDVTATYRVNEYQIKWIIDGNETVVNYNYGETIIEFSNPKKEGHNFAGWNIVIPKTMPSKDLEITAVWSVEVFMVTFKDYDGRIIKTDLIEINNSATAPKSPTREGYTFVDWDLDFSSITEDIDVTATYRVNEYQIKWIIDGNETVVNYNYGETIIEFSNPKKEGYNFAGWNIVIPKTMPSKNLEIKPTWSLNKYMLTYKVDEKVYSEMLIDYGSIINLLSEPVKRGYTFTGWEPELIHDTMPSYNIEIKGYFIPNKYVVTFEIGDGELETNIIEYTFDEIFKLPVPVIENKIFMGWYYGINKLEDGFWNIDEDITLIPKFINNTYTITYNFDGKVKVESSIYNENYEFYKPEKNGYTFLTWIDENGKKFNDNIIWTFEDNLILTALWKANTYKISFDLSNTNNSVSGLVQKVNFGDYFTIHLNVQGPAPFAGWYKDDVRFTDSKGNSLNPYLETEDITLTAMFYNPIYTTEDLFNMKYDLNTNYILHNDIDLTGKEWLSIGDSSYPFRGKFDGQGYTIKGLNIRITNEYVGLFGVTYNAEIKNVNFEEVNIDLLNDHFNKLYIGTVAGFSHYTDLINIKLLSGKINLNNLLVNETRVGGLVGKSYGSSTNLVNIENIENNINVNATFSDYVGGIIGRAYYTNLDKTYNSGFIEGNEYVGGIAGYSNSTIINSHNIGDIFGVKRVGGIIGYESDINILTNLINEGYIKGQDHVGGIIGTVINSTIINSYNKGEVLGYGDYIGGIIGWVHNKSKIENSYNIADISGVGSAIGGFIGYSSNMLEIHNSYNTGNIFGNSRVGGIIGSINSSLILRNIYNAGNIHGDNNASGIIGYLYRGVTLNINNVINFGDIYGKSTSISFIAHSVDILNVKNVLFYGKLFYNDKEYEIENIGAEFSLNNMNNKDYFMNTLLFDTYIWNLEDFDINLGIYPSFN